MKRLVARRSPRSRLLPVVWAVALAAVVACVSGSRYLRQYARRGVRAGPQKESCAETPVVNTAALGKWKCKLLQEVCLDEGRILLHSGQKTPLHHKWTNESLFNTPFYPSFVLPGYDEPLGTAHYKVDFSLDIRAPTPLDPPDVYRPSAFNSCVLPLIFWPWYFRIYGDFFTQRLASFYKMRAEGVFDSNVKFVPETNGMEAPHFYQTHLEPLTPHPVESLSSLSSRENIRTARSRCYRQILLCGMIIEYYKSKHPEQFRPVNDTFFRVAFYKRSSKSRVLLNQEEVLQQCKAWQLPPGTRFTEVHCYLIDDFEADNLVQSLAELQRINALVSMHGSGMTNAFFLPNNSAVVELICYDFCKPWADMYYRDRMEADDSTRSGYFRVLADREHCYPGEFERNNTGSHMAYKRDQDIRVTFTAVGEALAKIARGEVDSPPSNFHSRLFPMMRNESGGCPA